MLMRELTHICAQTAFVQNPSTMSTHHQVSKLQNHGKTPVSSPHRKLLQLGLRISMMLFTEMP